MAMRFFIQFLFKCLFRFDISESYNCYVKGRCFKGLSFLFPPCAVVVFLFSFFVNSAYAGFGKSVRNTEAGFKVGCVSCSVDCASCSVGCVSCSVDCASCSVDCASCSVDENLLQQISIQSDNIRTCNLLSYKQNLQEGRLSDYWAQELIGTDLLRQELKTVSPPKRKNWIAIFDIRRGNHNTYVKNLISDEGSYAVLPELEDEGALFFHTAEDEEYKPVLSVFNTSFPGDYASQDHHFEESSPAFINSSMGWLYSADIYEVFEVLSPPAVVITSSGNFFPQQGSDMAKKSKASKNFNTVIVGSFAPTGFVSDFSSSNKEVHIIAPSDRWISSAEEDGRYAKFGGTSGAVSLVTGSLAGFEWLSGYHPTGKEAKILLEKTAIPTLSSHEEPQVNGAGLVNAYKLGEVGKRLKKKCVSNVSCFKEEILNEENYHFDLDKNLSGDLNRAFPACARTSQSTGALSSAVSCAEKGKVFKKLRQAILLNPLESRGLLENLSCIYRRGGFSQNAEVLDKLILALGSREEVRQNVRALAKKAEPISDEIVRLMLGMGGFEEEFRLFENIKALKMTSGIGLLSALSLLERAFATGDLELQKVAVTVAGRIGEFGFPLVERAFDTGDLELQKVAVTAAGRIGEFGFPLVEWAFATGDLELQKVAVTAAGWIGEFGFPLVERAFATGDLELQKVAVTAAGWIGEFGFPLVERAFATGDLELQKVAVTAAGWIGEFDFPLVERAFDTGDLELQKRVVSVVGNMGRAGLPFLEQAFATGEHELQELAVSVAGHMGKAGLPFLNLFLQESQNQNVSSELEEEIKRLLDRFKVSS